MRKNSSLDQVKNVLGLAVICAVVAAFLYVFLGLARTDKKDRYLSGFGGMDCGWEYELLAEGAAKEMTPEFDEVGYIRYPVDRPEALKITRTMVETIPNAEIELYIYDGEAVEVFLDDELLYTDFQESERDPYGYLILDENVRQAIAARSGAYPLGKRARISLPDDYTGRKLKITTYFLVEMKEYPPCYPYLGCEVSRFAEQVAVAVMPVAMLVLCAVCVVLLLLVFFLDSSGGRKDGRILLLVLYFILLFLNGRYNSVLGDIGEMHGMWEIVLSSDLYMLPLCLYLALLLSVRRRLLAVCGMAVWVGYGGIYTWINLRDGFPIPGDMMGRGSFALALLFIALFLLEYFLTDKWKGSRKRNLSYTALAVFVMAVCVFYEANRAHDGNIVEYFQVTVSLMAGGYFVKTVSLMQNTCATMAVIVLVAEFLRRNAETRAMVAVLEERQRATLEGYNRMLRAEEAVYAERHEMRHHTMALMAFLRNHETERACEYLASIEEKIDQMPVFKYSQNMLVNVIAGTYLDRAKEQGIRVECMIAVPENLQIADEDLSVFLSNMLQNAVEACERMEKDKDRYIQLKMYEKEYYLFIGCVNSFSKTEEAHVPDHPEREHKEHGYGLEAMHQIAEKYGSILMVDRREDEFSVMSCIWKKPSRRRDSAGSQS